MPATPEQGVYPMRTLPIHIDRLQAALAAKGVKLKRHNLLEVAAAAFGFHSQNQFSAAAKNGELDPPLATKIGSAMLADTRVVFLQDPNGRPFCVDEDAISGSRAQSFVVTPYGELVDLRKIENVEPLISGTAKEIHYASILHEYGADLYQDTTRAGLDRQIADWCRTYWEQEGISESPEGLSDEEVIEVYFAHSEEEGVTYYESMTHPKALVSGSATPHIPDGFNLDQPYVIGQETGIRDEPFLYWSNEDGWVDSLNATVFSMPIASWPSLGAKLESLFVMPLPNVPIGGKHTRHAPEIVFLTNREGEIQGPADRAEEALPWIDADEIDVALGPDRFAEIGYAALINDAVFLAPTIKSFHYNANDPVRALIENRTELQDYADEIEPSIKAVGGLVTLEEDLEAVTLTIYIPLSEAQKATNLECWKEALQDLITPKGYGKRVHATFHPQVMINGGCYDADALGETRFDVTYEIKLMGNEAALDLEDTDHEAEALKDAIRAPSWISNWDGPFSLHVKNEVIRYYK